MKKAYMYHKTKLSAIFVLFYFYVYIYRMYNQTFLLQNLNQ